jgi:hypothetical protein
MASESGFSLRTKPRPIGNSLNFAKQQQKEWQDGLDVPLDLRVMAAAYFPPGLNLVDI